MALNLGFSAASVFGAGPQTDLNSLLHARGTSPVERRGRFPDLAVRAGNGTTGPTAHLFMDSVDKDFHFAASIVEACVSTTVYAVRCTSHPIAEYSTECGSNAPTIEVTQGPSTYRIYTDVATSTLGVQVKGFVEENCQLDGTTKAVCGATVSASASGQETMTTTTVTATGTDVYWYDVAITAGAEKTANPSQCSSSAASSVLNSKGVAVIALLGAMGVTALLGM